MFLLDVGVGLVLGLVLWPVTDYFELKHVLDDPTLTEMLLGVFLAPPLEEIIFRLWLRVNRTTLFAFAFLVLFTGVLLLPTSNWGAVLLMGLSVSLLVISLMGYDEDIERAVARRFGWVFYGSTLLFALVHVTNYTPLTTQTFLLAPLLVLPQFVGGTMLGYIRIRYGIGFSILYHAAFNAFFTFMVVIFPLGTDAG